MLIFTFDVYIIILFRSQYIYVYVYASMVYMYMYERVHLKFRINLYSYLKSYTLYQKFEKISNQCVINCVV